MCACIDLDIHSFILFFPGKRLPEEQIISQYGTSNRNQNERHRVGEQAPARKNCCSSN